MQVVESQILLENFISLKETEYQKRWNHKLKLGYALLKRSDDDALGKTSESCCLIKVYEDLLEFKWCEANTGKLWPIPMLMFNNG